MGLGGAVSTENIFHRFGFNRKRRPPVDLEVTPKVVDQHEGLQGLKPDSFRLRMFEVERKKKVDLC